MKALKVLTTIVKIATIFFAIIGVILTITMTIICKVYANHIYDVVEEYDSEDQDATIMTEAYRRTLSDPRVKDNKLINAIAYGVDKFKSFVANL